MLIPRSEKLQWETVGLLDLALVEWKPWTSGVYSWAICHRVFVGGSDAYIFCLPQFSVQSSLGLHDEFHFSTMAGKLHDFVQIGMYSRFTPYIEVHISDTNFTRLCTLTVMHAWNLYWLLGLHSSYVQIITEGATIFDSQYFG